MERGGFEPPKASPTDLQSVPFGRSGTSPQQLPFRERIASEFLYVPHQRLSGNPKFVRRTRRIHAGQAFGLGSLHARQALSAANILLLVTGHKAGNAVAILVQGWVKLEQRLLSQENTEWQDKSLSLEANLQSAG